MLTCLRPKVCLTKRGWFGRSLYYGQHLYITVSLYIADIIMGETAVQPLVD